MAEYPIVWGNYDAPPALKKARQSQPWFASLVSGRQPRVLTGSVLTPDSLIPFVLS